MKFRVSEIEWELDDLVDPRNYPTSAIVDVPYADAAVEHLERDWHASIGFARVNLEPVS